VATVVLVVMAALMGAALLGRGPLYGRFLAIERGNPTRGARHSRRVARRRHSHLAVRSTSGARAPAGGSRRGPGEPDTRLSDDDLDEVIQGAFAAETFNHAVRVLTGAFILVVLVIVTVSQLWQRFSPIFSRTLTLAGVFVLVVQDVIPRPADWGRCASRWRERRNRLPDDDRLAHGAPRALLLPLSAAGGGAALIASPAVTVLLAVESAVAYAVAAFSGPLAGGAARDALVRVAINLMVLVLLAYARHDDLPRSADERGKRRIRLSTVDSLTNLHNRAYCSSTRVDREIQRSRRFNRGFCLLMMDLDGLKTINDRFRPLPGRPRAPRPWPTSSARDCAAWTSRPGTAAMSRGPPARDGAVRAYAGRPRTSDGRERR